MSLAVKAIISSSDKFEKYVLTDESIIQNGRKLFRIRALIDIPEANVVAGDYGGFIQSEHNLSHKDSAWIGYFAMVFDKARISDDAQISDESKAFNFAKIYGNAKIRGDRIVWGFQREGGCYPFKL